jgi:hypothetical protein
MRGNDLASRGQTLENGRGYGTSAFGVQTVPSRAVSSNTCCRGKTCLARGANSYDNGRSSSQSTYSTRSAKNQEPLIFTKVSEYRSEATIKRFFPLSTVT